MYPSWWRFVGSLVFAAVMVILGLYVLAARREFANEIELADIRSVEVDQRFIQRLLGLGNITVASAASADFLIRLEDISNPDAIAEQLRQARLKRLA